MPCVLRVLAIEAAALLVVAMLLRAGAGASGPKGEAE
jgi:hypothetical protein